ncbi:SpoVT/AbrB domain protein [Thauera linaloolentis 47Lol = DSM 12138]|uniref:SpoVT/AbrB domain protein n=1 Tax=Thauera linaloolentis (strain DSM 12138 / JCM 21573 / CCUG 41526 / CIP 105981 / IAM 15112 / NBRC 102519 / 47Lol) TaxID=1123367 RepID=N6YG51_THAL4|nr:SpoVT/AbrB domain protein [Thauera linaloolentis 47Lol = DSM 12138]
MLHVVEVPADLMAERPLNRPPPERGVFDDEAETSDGGKR